MKITCYQPNKPLLNWRSGDREFSTIHTDPLNRPSVRGRNWICTLKSLSLG